MSVIYKTALNFSINQRKLTALMLELDFFNLTQRNKMMKMKLFLATVIAACFITSPVFAAGKQQEKMKTCNTDATAKALKGDDRKAFMKTCLSAQPEPAGNSQQNKMKTCNAEAKTKALAGADRKTFMKTCLSNGQ